MESGLHLCLVGECMQQLPLQIEELNTDPAALRQTEIQIRLLREDGRIQRSSNTGRCHRKNGGGEIKMCRDSV